MPTLMVSWALAGSAAARLNASPAVVATRKWRANGRSATAAMDVCIAMSFCLTRGKRRKAVRGEGFASGVPSGNGGINACAGLLIGRVYGLCPTRQAGALAAEI